jgi:hypothetical protein
MTTPIIVDSPRMKVYQSTGFHYFQVRQRIRPMVVSAAPGYIPGHLGPGERDTIQQLTMLGGPTGGNFRLTFNGAQTGDIPYNATTDQVQGALENLASVGAGNVVVNGAVGAWLVEFQQRMGNSPQPLITYQNGTAPLSGGTVPSVQVSKLQSGGGKPSPTLPPVGGNDDIDAIAAKVIEARSPALGNVAAPHAPVGNLIRTGTVTPPPIPTGSTFDPNLIKVWRGHTFSKRISWPK